jgi:antitoxin CcdA
MSRAVHAPKPRRKSVRLSIDGDLLARAQAEGVDLARALEERLVEVLRDESRRRWEEENREAIAAYNHNVEEHGVFGDDVRCF